MTDRARQIGLAKQREAQLERVRYRLRQRLAPAGVKHGVELAKWRLLYRATKPHASGQVRAQEAFILGLVDEYLIGEEPIR